jgi:hypothetical protein
VFRLLVMNQHLLLSVNVNSRPTKDKVVAITAADAEQEQRAGPGAAEWAPRRVWRAE